MSDSLPGTFRVDVQQLSGLAGHLEDCASEMKSAGYQMEQASVQDIGHAGLEARCGEFRDAWKYGIGQLSKLTAAIQGGLRQTATNYAQTDRGISEFFAGGGSASGGATAPSGSMGPSGKGSAPAAHGKSYGMADDFG